MVFLSVFALFGLGRFASVDSAMSAGSTPHNLGKVLSPRDFRVSTTTATVEILSAPSSASTSNSGPEFFEIVVDSVDDIISDKAMVEEIPVVIEDARNQRVLGRIFAWLCTTLYLTSRLPQIWKNVRIPCPPVDLISDIHSSPVRSEISRGNARFIHWFLHQAADNDHFISGPLDLSIYFCIPRKHILCSIHPHITKCIPPSTRLHTFYQRNHPVRNWHTSVSCILILIFLLDIS